MYQNRFFRLVLSTLQKSKHLACAVCAYILSVQIALAGSIHIDTTNGNDTWDGTASDPIQTLTELNRRVGIIPANDNLEIVFHPGTYWLKDISGNGAHGGNSCSNYPGYPKSTKNGIEIFDKNDVTVRPLIPGSVVLDGTGTYSNAFHVGRSSNLKFEPGMLVSNVAGAAINLYASQNIAIKGWIFDGVIGCASDNVAAIKFHDKSGGMVLIDSNTFKNISDPSGDNRYIANLASIIIIASSANSIFKIQGNTFDPGDTSSDGSYRGGGILEKWAIESNSKLEITQNSFLSGSFLIVLSLQPETAITENEFLGLNQRIHVRNLNGPHFISGSNARINNNSWHAENASQAGLSIEPSSSGLGGFILESGVTFTNNRFAVSEVSGSRVLNITPYWHPIQSPAEISDLLTQWTFERNCTSRLSLSGSMGGTGTIYGNWPQTEIDTYVWRGDVTEINKKLATEAFTLDSDPACNQDDQSPIIVDKVKYISPISVQANKTRPVLFEWTNPEHAVESTLIIQFKSQNTNQLLRSDFTIKLPEVEYCNYQRNCKYLLSSQKYKELHDDIIASYSIQTNNAIGSGPNSGSIDFELVGSPPTVEFHEFGGDVYDPVIRWENNPSSHTFHLGLYQSKWGSVWPIKDRVTFMRDQVSSIGKVLSIRLSDVIGDDINRKTWRYYVGLRQSNDIGISNWGFEQVRIR